jgi:hypothetical protein
MIDSIRHLDFTRWVYTSEIITIHEVTGGAIDYNYLEKMDWLDYEKLRVMCEEAKNKGG